MKRLILLLALSACASPEPRYFTLATTRGTPSAAPAPSLIELRRPGLAGYLDRPGIVRANSAYNLTVASEERWAEPLGDMVGRVLAEDLGNRLPGSSVFTSAGSISAEPNATVELDIQRFDADAGGPVVLLAQVAVSRGRTRANATTRTVRATVTPPGPTTADIALAMSDALGQLADQLAAMLRGG